MGSGYDRRVLSGEAKGVEGEDSDEEEHGEAFHFLPWYGCKILVYVN